MYGELHYIAVATPEEVSLIERFPQLKGMPVIVTGVGGLNVIASLSGISRDARITNIGYAGGVDLEIGKIYSVKSAALLHGVDFIDKTYYLSGQVPCYSSSDFVTKGEKGCLYDMELAFICALGFKGVNSYKIVSDHCDYEEYEKHLVSSFDVDHAILDAGLYQRSKQANTISWDLRFRAPREHRPLTPGASHVIEHVFAQGLRENREIGNKVITFCPMGCLTGFYLITTDSVYQDELARAIKEAAARYFPLVSVGDVPGMNTKQCGNPALADVPAANEAVDEYIKKL